MRRGLGIAHVQQRQEMQIKMAELGEQITAQRVGQIADQLELLERQLRELASKYKDDIKHDPVVRARFRQLADSLGVDLISSKKNVFSGVLGLGDFYFALASKVVEACMREEKFCGAFVPLRRVLDYVQQSYDATLTADNEEETEHSHTNLNVIRTQKYTNSGNDTSTNYNNYHHDDSKKAQNTKSSDKESRSKKGKRTVISREDVLTALKKLEVFGTGYDVVEINGVSYVQTSADGTRGNESVPLLNYVLQVQEQQVNAAKKKMLQNRQSSGRESVTSDNNVQSQKNRRDVITETSTKNAKDVLGKDALSVALSKEHKAKQHEPSEQGSSTSSPSTEIAIGSDGQHDRMRLGLAYLMKSDVFQSEKDNIASCPLSATDEFKARSVALTAEQVCEELHWPLHRTRAVLNRLVQNGTVWIDYVDMNDSTVQTGQSKRIASTETATTTMSNKRKSVVYWFITLRGSEVASTKK